MITNQPIWKYIANLGDKDPIDHGGYFIYEDETGVYPPEGELLIAPDADPPDPKEGEDPEDKKFKKWTVFRFILNKCIQQPFWPYTLSDNPYHPNLPAWFAEFENGRRDDINGMASFADLAPDILRQMFCSWKTLDRARAWQIVGEYFGFENLDSYPLHLAREEAIERYTEELYADGARKSCTPKRTSATES
jgi:hypothetical protein